MGKFVYSGLSGAVYASALLLAALASGLDAQSATHAQQQFTNPVLWEDLADIDILRVGNAYYYSASNMHYSPGAPILRSYDLLHWRYVGHSVPILDFGPNYDMAGGTAYVRGTWASFLGYRKSKKTFYWGGCVDFQKTYIYTAPAAEGPWNRHAVIDKCYYDSGLLVDEDDTLYVVYGNTKIHVAQLSPDAAREVKEEIVFTSPQEIGTLEGSRFYRDGGNYYIFTTHPPNGEYVLRSTTGPLEPVYDLCT
jgi:beta-xylosidase